MTSNMLNNEYYDPVTRLQRGDTERHRQSHIRAGSIVEGEDHFEHRSRTRVLLSGGRRADNTATTTATEEGAIEEKEAGVDKD